MSRLKDALDKAARTADEQSKAFTPPAHVVPEAWPFQEGDELAAQIVGEAPLRANAV